MGESFKDLLVWQRAMQLTVAVYAFPSRFPSDERFGLTNQLRRASVSVASNIAEGYGRSTTGGHLQFLGMARGSNSEVQTQIEIAERINFGNAEERATANNLADEVGHMLVSMMKKLRE